MNNKAFYNLTYGVFLLAAKAEEKANACIVNTGVQVAGSPVRVAVSVLKYLLILSALFSAFDKLNTDYALVGPRTVGQSKCYEPVLRLSEAVFPFLEWVGDRVPQRDE